MFQGSGVALITPFKNGKIDEAALRLLIEEQIQAGTQILIPCGTTGESATLSHEEHDRVIDLTIEVAQGRAKVLAGAGSNSTEEAIRLTQHAKKSGADGTLQINPYYNKPTQEGLYRHFEAIARAVDLPIILYNIPGRTGVNMSPSTMARLAKLDLILGVKEASGSLEQVSRILEECPSTFTVLSGEDGLTFPMLALGARGAISVTANLLPRLCANMMESAQQGRWDEARHIHFRLAEINRALFWETNPIPVKTAFAMMGKIQDEFRLPLTSMDSSHRENFRRVLQSYGLLS